MPDLDCPSLATHFLSRPLLPQYPQIPFPWTKGIACSCLGYALVSFSLLPLPAMVQGFLVHNYRLWSRPWWYSYAFLTLLINQYQLYVISQWFLITPEDLKTCMQSKCFYFVCFTFWDILSLLLFLLHFRNFLAGLFSFSMSVGTLPIRLHRRRKPIF